MHHLNDKDLKRQKYFWAKLKVANVIFKIKCMIDSSDERFKERSFFSVVSFSWIFAHQLSVGGFSFRWSQFRNDVKISIVFFVILMN